MRGLTQILKQVLLLAPFFVYSTVQAQVTPLGSPYGGLKPGPIQTPYYSFADLGFSPGESGVEVLGDELVLGSSVPLTSFGQKHLLSSGEIRSGH